ncbi:MAG: hypothetical protein ABSA73_00530 [Terracidiphilus sp.]|jgi:hypothetical protein
MIMLKTPKYAVTLFALAVVCLLAAPAVSLAESGQEKTAKFVDHGEGKQQGPTKTGDKNTPKKTETHHPGTVTKHSPANVGHLKGPEMRESGKGRLEGGEKKGDKSTPKRNPTSESKPV